MPTRRMRPCDDSANSRSTADDALVHDIKVPASFPRALLQSHGEDDTSTGTQESYVKLLTDSHLRYGGHDVADVRGGPAIHGQENVPLSEATIGGRRARNDRLDQDARSCSQVFA